LTIQVANLEARNTELIEELEAQKAFKSANDSKNKSIIEKLEEENR